MAPGREEMITMMFWYGSSWAWWQAGLMWLAMIAFWALLIWAIYALVTGITRRPDKEAPGGQQPADARRILDERLARGEIDTTEYQRLRDVLDGGSSRSTAGSGGAR
jgi:putative membrane protein